MVVWEIRFERRACKDASRLKAAGLKERADKILERIQEDPYYSPPPFEKLIGDLAGFYSRRINIKHRIVYEVLPDDNHVKVHMMYSHYGD